MKEPTSSEETLLNETPGAESWRVCDALEEELSEGWDLRPVNASQTPILTAEDVWRVERVAGGSWGDLINGRLLDGVVC